MATNYNKQYMDLMKAVKGLVYSWKKVSKTEDKNKKSALKKDFLKKLADTASKIDSVIKSFESNIYKLPFNVTVLNVNGVKGFINTNGNHYVMNANTPAPIAKMKNILKLLTKSKQNGVSNTIAKLQSQVGTQTNVNKNSPPNKKNSSTSMNAPPNKKNSSTSPPNKKSANASTSTNAPKKNSNLNIRLTKQEQEFMNRLRQTENKAQAAVNALEAKLSKKSNNEGVQQKLKAAEQALKNAHNKLANAEKKSLAELEAAKATGAKNLNAALAARNAEAKASVNKLTAELEAAKAAGKNTNDIRQKLKNAENRLANNQLALAAKNTELSERNKKEAARNAELLEKNKKAKENVNKLTAELEAARAAGKNTNDIRQKLKNAENRLANNQLALAAKNTELLEKNKKAKENVNKLSAELAKAKADGNKTSAIQARLNSAIKNRNAKHAALKKSHLVEKFGGKLLMKKALENAKRVAANASGKNKAEANAEVQRLRMELANKTKLNQNLQSVKAELSAALAAKEANKSGANARVANAERKAEELEARLQQAVANKNAEISAIKQGSNAEKNSLITQLRAEQESLKKGLNEIAKTASENASRLQASLNAKIKEAQNAQNALARAKNAHENTKMASKELQNAKDALAVEKGMLQNQINRLQNNLKSSKKATAAERNALRSELNAVTSSKTALEQSMKELSEEKESSVAALKQQLKNAQNGSNAEITKARKEATNLKANLERQLANKMVTQANKVRLGGELNAARKAIANFEEKLASVKPLLNEQARKNKEQKNRRDALSVKISLLKGPNVIRRSDIIISALANSSNKELQEAARKKVLSTIGSKNHDGRLSLNANNIHKLDYIARQLDSHKDMSAINMYELLTINKKNKKIRAKGPVPYGANNKRPVSGKPSSGVAPRSTMVRGEPVLSVEDSGVQEEQNKSKKTRRNGGMIKATPAARQAVVERRPKPFVGPMAG